MLFCSNLVSVPAGFTKIFITILIPFMIKWFQTYTTLPTCSSVIRNKHITPGYWDVESMPCSIWYCGNQTSTMKQYDNDPHQCHTSHPWSQPKTLSTLIFHDPYVWKVANISISLIISSVSGLRLHLQENPLITLCATAVSIHASVSAQQSTSIDCCQSAACNKLLITHASPIHEYISHSLGCWAAV